MFADQQAHNARNADRKQRQAQSDRILLQPRAQQQRQAGTAQRAHDAQNALLERRRRGGLRAHEAADRRPPGFLNMHSQGYRGRQCHGERGRRTAPTALATQPHLSQLVTQADRCVRDHTQRRYDAAHNRGPLTVGRRSWENQHPGIRAHIELQVRRRIDQCQRHGNPPLQPDPVRRWRNIGQ